MAWRGNCRSSVLLSWCLYKSSDQKTGILGESVIIIMLSPISAITHRNKEVQDVNQGDRFRPCQILRVLALLADEMDRYCPIGFLPFLSGTTQTLSALKIQKCPDETSRQVKARALLGVGVGLLGDNCCVGGSDKHSFTRFP